MRLFPASFNQISTLLAILYLSCGELAAQPLTLVQDINPGFEDSDPEFLGIRGEDFFFMSDDGSTGHELWVTNGEDGTTYQVKDIFPGSSSSMDPNSLGRYQFIEFGENFIFPADDGQHGLELWITDGTESGTHLIKDLSQILGGSLEEWFPHAVLDDVLYFEANTLAPGIELWRTDGTENGTYQLAIPEFELMNGQFALREMTSYGNQVFLTTQDAATQATLWVIDGTGNGVTKLVEHSNPNDFFWNFLEKGDFLFFDFVDPTSSHQTYWRTDGTAAGTLELFDSWVAAIEKLQNEFIFLTRSSNSGAFNQVYTTTGIPNDNELIFHDPDVKLLGFANHRQNHQSKNRVFMTGTTDNLGAELWTSDGTTTGTQLVVDLEPGPGNGYFNHPFAQGDDFSLFMARTDDLGFELWRTDGTELGSSLVKDIAPGPASGLNFGWLLSERTPIIYFHAEDGVHGRELWQSDGTAEGTFMVQDIAEGFFGSLSSSAGILHQTAEYLYLEADDIVHGNELWRMKLPPALGIGEQQESARGLVFPNPSTGIVQLQGLPISSQSGAMVAYIYDTSGKLVSTRQLDVTTSFLDLSNLRQGMYWIQVAGSTMTYKAAIVR